MKKRSGVVPVLALAAMLGVPAGGASAQSLTEAMVQAYATNPTLRAARAGQRATDELVPRALSGWRPTVTADANVSATTIDGAPDSSNGSLSITLNQPIFNGFKTINSTKAAEATVAAGEQGLLSTEQNVLFQAVQAYMGVIRDRSIVSLRKRQVSVLNAQLRAANDRFQAGEATRTDVSQARSRVSGAEAQVAAAQASLGASNAAFIKIIGKEPGKLSYPRSPKLPGSLDSALETASQINPNVLAAALIEESSVYQIEVAKGDLLPTVSLRAEGRVSDNFSINGGDVESATISGVVSVPIYDGGRTYSSVREAKHTASKRRIEVIEANRAVREAVAVAWNSLNAARQTIVAAKSQLSAANLALDGVQQEYEAGTRTLLDVLNAQTEVFDARITQVNAEHDAVVAAFQLLSSMGQLTANYLKLPVAGYDAAENYGNVRNKWFGTGVETVK